MKRSLIITLVIASTGMLATSMMWSPETPIADSDQLAERINLALRQTGHQLLTLAGNDSSFIPPVKQIAENEFFLKLESEFNYDTLPYILAKAFEDFGIEAEYQVAIKNCHSDTLILGYNFLAFENNNVACMGREQRSTCNNISVSFHKKANSFNSNSLVAMSLALIGFLMVRLYLFQKNESEGRQNASPKNKNLIQIGYTIVDFNNQSIEINGQRKDLTFRENKLLYYFAKHPNQVLEREKILSDVWGDEGIIVGRSLDVFVSRLRKIIGADTSLKIKNVHGVGYRMEVSA